MTSPSPQLAGALGLARLEYHERVTSTMDVAHALAAEHAPAGTLVLASAQLSGRGRSGKAWVSAPDAGLWCTLLERPADVRALDVLALRVGLELAVALTPLVDGDIELKWPNDLQIARRKLGGVLIEARWRDGQPEWVAIGVGINRRLPPELSDVTCVRHDVSRDALLTAVVPALRCAASCTGPLTADECEAWAARDAALGRRVVAPVAGRVVGLTPEGGLLVQGGDSIVHVITSGSLTFAP